MSEEFLLKFARWIPKLLKCLNLQWIQCTRSRRNELVSSQAPNFLSRPYKWNLWMTKCNPSSSCHFVESSPSTAFGSYCRTDYDIISLVESDLRTTSVLIWFFFWGEYLVPFSAPLAENILFCQYSMFITDKSVLQVFIPVPSLHLQLLLIILVGCLLIWVDLVLNLDRKE